MTAAFASTPASDSLAGTANALRERGFRVAYVDIDAHHGDGVQFAFYRDPKPPAELSATPLPSTARLRSNG